MRTPSAPCPHEDLRRVLAGIEAEAVFEKEAEELERWTAAIRDIIVGDRAFGFPTDEEMDAVTASTTPSGETLPRQRFLRKMSLNK